MKMSLVTGGYVQQHPQRRGKEQKMMKIPAMERVKLFLPARLKAKAIMERKVPKVVASSVEATITRLSAQK